MITSSLSPRSFVPVPNAPIDDAAGWLGQVPPPVPEPPAPPCAVDDAPTYANPQLAPDPWLAPDPLYPSDPTLFG